MRTLRDVKVPSTLHGDRKVFSVSAFNQGIGIVLRRLPSVWIEGEVTELRRNEAWAFVFFTLKDPASGATVRATIQRRRFDQLELALADGERVLVEGKAEIYESKGELSFRASTIERIGLGDHLAAIERLKRVLAAEGLFAAERKRPLPRFPRAVGVVTGADAAARGDVIAEHLLPVSAGPHRRRRDPRPGRRGRPPDRLGAPAGRGPPGRRRGHRRPWRWQLRGSPSLQRRGGRPCLRRFARCPSCPRSGTSRTRRSATSPPMCAPRRRRPRRGSSCPDLAELQAGLTRLRRLLDGSVRRALVRDRERLERDGARLRAAPLLLLERRRVALDHAAARLQALSPRATLARGYAVVRAGGAALRESATVAPGAPLEIELATGSLGATVDRGAAVSADGQEQSPPSRSFAASWRRSSAGSSVAMSGSTRRSSSGSGARRCIGAASSCSRRPRAGSRSSAPGPR